MVDRLFHENEELSGNSLESLQHFATLTILPEP